MALRNTIAIAWRRIFGSLTTSSAADEFRNMFDDEEYLESRVFQPLHKVVLEIGTETSKANMEQLLQLSTSSIDDVDADGRTALSWASARGDMEAVRTLLRFKADPNTPSYWGQSSLHWAAQNKGGNAMSILKALIEGGANVNALDYWNRTALTYVSGNHPSIESIKLLVEQGTALDVRDRRLRTALGYAARIGNFKHVQYLLAQGADPNIADEFNVLPMLEAVRNNFHDILRILLPVSDPLEIQPYGSSLLHWVAMYADAGTLDELSRGDLNMLFDGSELMRIDADSHRPQEIIAKRPNLPESMTTRLEGLVQKIEKLCIAG
jgi:ankyrin repeat protein